MNSDRGGVVRGLGSLVQGRYGPGTYVIKFTDAEGTCYDRVVVE